MIARYFAYPIAGIMMAGPALALQIYDKDGTTMDITGRLQTVYYSKDTNLYNPESGDGTLVANGRLGFALSTPITDGVDAISYVEWDVSDGDKFDHFRNRYAWVGLDFGKFGKVRAGTSEDAFYYVQMPVDIYIDFGAVGLASKDDRRKGQFMYNWSGYGVDFNITYGTSKDNQPVDGAYWGRQTSDGGDFTGSETLNIEQAFSVSAGYTSPEVLFGPIGVRAGYGYAEFGEHFYEGGVGQNQITGSNTEGTAVFYDDYNQYGASLFWGSLKQGPYVAAMYQVREFKFTDNVDVSDIFYRASGSANNYDVMGSIFSIGYGFSNGMGIYTGFEYSTVEWEHTNFDVESSTIPLILNWNVTPHLRTWIEGRLDVGTHDTGNNVPYPVKQYYEDVFSMGLRFLL